MHRCPCTRHYLLTLFTERQLKIPFQYYLQEIISYWLSTHGIHTFWMSDTWIFFKIYAYTLNDDDVIVIFVKFLYIYIYIKLWVLSNSPPVSSVWSRPTHKVTSPSPPPTPLPPNTTTTTTTTGRPFWTVRVNTRRPIVRITYSVSASSTQHLVTVWSSGPVYLFDFVSWPTIFSTTGMYHRAQNRGSVGNGGT